MTHPAAAPPAIPAATLVILREADGRPPDLLPDLLMVERAKTMAFAGGAMVFPGGRVDPADHISAALAGMADNEGAARVAAIRETLEEVGLAIGIEPPPLPAAIGRMRAGLHDGQSFAAVLAREGATLDLSILVPFARWRPAHRVSRVFDTRFYLARLPSGAAMAEVDGTENARLIWTTATAALAAAAAGRMTLIYPTRRNLERLAPFASFAAAVADARAHPVTMIVPTAERRDGIDWLCIPDGMGYPVTAEPMTTAMRG